MDNVFRFNRSDYWGTGHWIVTFPEGAGRVSIGSDGKWSAFDWTSAPIPGITPRPAIASGLTTRKDAAILLRVVQQVADELHAEMDELLKQGR